MSGRVIAIDGPAASGKSSVSRGVATALGFQFISSGHLYRALAWWAVRSHLLPQDFDKEIKHLSLQVQEEDLSFRIFIHGEDATPHLSAPEVASLVSPLAVLPSVRDLVNMSLRSLAAGSDLVIEGRDIGSVVFPETPYKFYLDATPEERARRRAQEGAVDSVAERDRLDSTRATAPLMIPTGATIIDTTHLSLEQVVELVLVHLKASPFPLR